MKKAYSNPEKLSKNNINKKIFNFKTINLKKKLNLPHQIEL